MLLYSFNGRKWFKYMAIFALVLVVAVIVYSVILLTSHACYDGIRFEGIDLGGLERSQAGIVIEELFKKNYAEKPVVLDFDDNTLAVYPEDINLRFLTENILDKAYSIGRTGNILKRLSEVTGLKFKKRDIIPEFAFDKKLFIGILADIKFQTDKIGRSATAAYEKGKITVIEDEPGRVLDIKKNLTLFTEKISSGSFNEISLVVDKVKPEITFDDIKDIDHVLSTFTTTFNPDDKNRTHNVKLSCDKISGMILMPGDIFSMNKALGPRTAENGYKESRIVYKNEYIDGIGGGVCQTTTTLYNSVLKSKLEVIERSHHSLPSLYVGLGQDATIAEDYIDFKFQNNKEYPICINAEVEKNKMTIRILGRKEDDNFTIKLVSEIVEQYVPDEEEMEIDNSLPDGKKVIEREPRNGFRVILYRETYDEKGELLGRQKISEDVYKPVKALVKVNEAYYNMLNSGTASKILDEEGFSNE